MRETAHACLDEEREKGTGIGSPGESGQLTAAVSSRLIRWQQEPCLAALRIHTDNETTNIVDTSQQ
jgi:hypothetical protein